MDHQDMYNLHCKGEFVEIKKGLDDILAILKGDGDKSGLCDRVRDLEKSRANVLKVVGALAMAAVAQLGSWIKGMF